MGDSWHHAAGPIRKRCCYFILGCHDPLSLPFVLPWNVSQYAIDHSRWWWESAARCSRAPREHVKVCHETGALAKHNFISSITQQGFHFHCCGSCGLVPVFCSVTECENWTQLSRKKRSASWNWCWLRWFSVSKRLDPA